MIENNGDELRIRIGDDIGGYSAKKVYGDDNIYVGFGSGNRPETFDTKVVTAYFRKLRWCVTVTDKWAVERIMNCDGNRFYSTLLWEVIQRSVPSDLLTQTQEIIYKKAFDAGRSHQQQLIREALAID